MKYVLCAMIVLAASSLRAQGGAWEETELLLAQPPSPPALSDSIIDANFIQPPGVPLVGPGVPTIGLDGQAIPGDVQATLDVWDATMQGGAEDFRGYRLESASTDWITGNELGMVSFNFGTTFQKRGVGKGLATSFAWHLLSGPAFADVPPRVYDFSLGYQARDWRGSFGYDVSAAVTASSDFEGSSRDGIRYPSHAVGFLRLAPWVDVVMGVDFIDRQDVGLLPVAGVILRPRQGVQWQLVFPRPRLDISLTPTNRLYFSGDLGGGQWAIEREVALVDDLLTYSDLRVAVGIETSGGPQISGTEIVWLFQRKIEFSSDVGNADLDDSLMLRFFSTN